MCSDVIAEEVDNKKDDLQQSESKDPGKVEIIKQIKRVNADGSYTFGYEAEDGTFKIESRDVLGNVKGTFGFVDQDGEIKRVTYSSSNGSETSSLAPVDKDRSVVQLIPRTNKNNTTTRRPSAVYTHITPSPSSTVIQTIPRRRASSSQNSSTTTTERPSFKHIVKSSEFEVSSSRSQTTTEPTPRVLASHQPRTIYQNGHFIRSTLSPQIDVQRYTEGQIIRPTHPETVTPRPNDNGYLRRLIVTRNPLFDEQINPTLKPITEVIDDADNVRGNLLRRQLNQEKINDYDARQHLLNLHQSTGSDAADVHGGQLTTGTPRPLFTTTSRPRLTSTVTTAKSIVSPVKYPVVFQKNAIRGPRPLQDQYQPESTTDASNIAETNYVTPTPIPIIQYPHDQNGLSYLRGRPLPRGAVLIPVNQVPNRYVYDDQNYPENQQYSQPYIHQDQYVREETPQRYIQATPYPRGTPIPYIVDRRRVPEDDRDYRRQEIMQDYIRPYQIPIATNLQDDIDNIKPPVSTLDFQKLLNRLIIRQNHLRELSRYENSRTVSNYYSTDRYRNIPQQLPVSIFVRARDGQNNGPIQFLQGNQARQNQGFITVPRMTQQKMESQQQYHATDPYNPDNYDPTPLYRHGRRAGRLIDQNLQTKELNENFLPADVREMLLLKMLQLAINPNLPIPPTDQEMMTTANPPHRKEAVRNVQILGEEREEEEKRNVRSKRFPDQQDADEMDYYQ